VKFGAGREGGGESKVEEEEEEDEGLEGWTRRYEGHEEQRPRKSQIVTERERESERGKVAQA